MLIRPQDETTELLEWVKTVWTYDLQTGEFRWLPQPVEEFEPSHNMTARRNMARWNGSFAGSLAGTAKPDKPRVLTRKGMVFKAERVAVALTIDAWPNGTVRFVDRDPSNLLRANLTYVEGIWTR